MVQCPGNKFCFDNYREDCKGFTPLLLAIKRKSLKVVELLLSEGVVSNGASHHNDNDLSALSLACSVGSYDTVRLLMAEKAEIKVKDGGKKTPLMEAAEHNQPKIIKYLLDEAKVDIEARDPIH